MTHEEALDILETIKAFYPRFELNKQKAMLFVSAFKKMDYPRMMEQLTAFAIEHPFPPTIAEIAAYPPETNTHLEQIRRWQKEAAMVPEATKRRLQQEMKRLIMEHQTNECS